MSVLILVTNNIPVLIRLPGRLAIEAGRTAMADRLASAFALDSLDRIGVGIEGQRYASASGLRRFWGGALGHSYLYRMNRSRQSGCGRSSVDRACSKCGGFAAWTTRSPPHAKHRNALAAVRRLVAFRIVSAVSAETTPPSSRNSQAAHRNEIASQSR